MGAEGPGGRRRAALALALLAACGAAVLGLRQGAAAARRGGAAFDLARDRFPVEVVETSAELRDLWLRRGLRGRVLVHLGTFLHFVEPDRPSAFRVSATYPLGVEPLPPAATPVSHRNFLWVAVHENVARHVWSVIPPPAFRERFGVRWGTPLEDVRDDQEGVRRTITASLPAPGEPVVLAVDASWFSSADPAVLVRQLRGSRLRADLVTVSLALDNPDVADAERVKALGFLDLLSEHAEIRAAGPGERPGR